MLSDLLGINASSTGQAIPDTRQLLAEHGRTITPTTLRFATADARTGFLSGGGREPARPQLADRHAEPVLGGMPRAEFAALIERVVPVLAARVERHRHRQRGGERLPGPRGYGLGPNPPRRPAGSPDLDRTAVLAPPSRQDRRSRPAYRVDEHSKITSY